MAYRGGYPQQGYPQQSMQGARVPQGYPQQGVQPMRSTAQGVPQRQPQVAGQTYAAPTNTRSTAAPVTSSAGLRSANPTLPAKTVQRAAPVLPAAPVVPGKTSAPGSPQRQKQVAERKPVQLPAGDFIYIGRPVEQFHDRWKAIYQVIVQQIGPPSEGKEFNVTDIGSHTGYFSLNISQYFSGSEVISVEGSVGVGNADVGRDSSADVARQSTSGFWKKIAETGAIKTHLKWMDALEIENNVVCPEVWRYDRIKQLKADGFFTDVLLLLSVVHHIDGVCEEQYKARGLQPIAGTLSLLAALFDLANVVVIELANAPWIQHMHDAFPSQQAILEAACAESGDRWTMQRVYQNEWYGIRDMWVLCRVDKIERTKKPSELRNYFANPCGLAEIREDPRMAQQVKQTQPAQSAARASTDLVGDLTQAPANRVDLSGITGSPEELADVIEEATALLLDARSIKQQSAEFMLSLETAAKEGEAV